MSISDLVTAIRRYAVLVTVALVLTVATAWWVSRPRSVQLATADVLFVAPATGAGTRPNPLADDNSALVAMAALVARTVEPQEWPYKLTDPTLTIVDEGVTSGEKVSIPDRGGQWSNDWSDPTVVVQVSGADRQAVAVRAQDIVDQIGRTLETTQTDAGVPAARQITSHLVHGQIQVATVTAAPSLAGLLAALGGLLATLAGVAALDTRTRSRSSHGPQEAPSAVPPTTPSRDVRLTIIVPAHNEAPVISRLLTALDDGYGPLLDVIVVANGCTDDTVGVARAFATQVATRGMSVRVLDLPQPSKAAALAAGNDLADPTLPRSFVDADLVISGRDLVVLADQLAQRGLLAVGPERVMVMDDASWVVRAYTRAWERLPQVSSDLFGRPMVISAAAFHERLGNQDIPMSDDLAFSEAFAPDERAIVPGTFVHIWTARTTRALLNRRVRIHIGNTQLDEVSGRRPQSRTSLSSLLRSARGHGPAAYIDAAVFMGMAVAARLGARRSIKRGDLTWRRDDSRDDNCGVTASSPG